MLAIDGEVESVPTVWAVAPELADGTLNAKKDFLRFKQTVLEGGDTKTWSVGKDNLLVCIGRTHDAQLKFPTPLTPGEDVSPAPLVTEETVGDGNAKDVVDAQVEVQRKIGVPMQDVGGDDDFNVVSGTPEEGTESGNSLYGYLVMLGLGLLAYNSVDVNINLLA